MNIGAELRQAREARGLSIGALSATTRIPPRTLEGIERNDLSAVPPHPYARGFVAAFAREVGLDPDGTARAYFAQFDPPPPSRHPTGSAQTAGTDDAPRSYARAAAVLTVLLAVAAYLAWPTPVEHADPAAVGTTGESVPPPPEATAARPGDVHPAARPVGSSPVSPASSPREIVVVLETEHPSWIAAAADGERVLYRIVPPGSKETLRARRDLTIRVGDAGAVRWSVDGRPLEVMGRRGEVRDVRLGRE